MLPADLLEVLPLYAAQIAEERASMPFPYPQPTPETLAVASRDLLAAMGENRRRAAEQQPPVWLGYVDTDHAKIIGYLWGAIVRRPLVAPSTIFRAEVAYVIPRARRTGVTRQLVALAWEAAQHAGATVFEAVYVPGSPSAAIWEGVGFRPYKVEAAFVDAVGQPYQHAPLALPEPELIAVEG